MKQSTNILRRRSWLLPLLALFTWLLPQTAAADTYVDRKENYKVSLGGTNIIYFQAPAYDTEGADCWVVLGSLKVSGDGIPEQVIFQWQSEKDINNSNTSLSCYFSTPSSTFFNITLGNSRSVFKLTKDNSGWQPLARNSDGKTFEFSAEWMVPYNMLGKELTFTWDVKRDGNSRTEEKVSGLETTKVKVPAASNKLVPTITQGMLNPNDPGKIEVPWFLASDKITKAHYEYDDANGKHHSEKIENATSGIIVLNATEPHRNFRVVCSYKEAAAAGEYDIEDVASKTMNLSMIHAPVALTAYPLGDRKSKVELTWTVPYLDDGDMTPTDFFEIQRSLTGKEEDFVTIFEQFYSTGDKKTTYTYIDSTLVEDITADMLTDGGTLANLTYRVRRVITKDWGWDHNCAATTKCVLDRMHLLRISDYTAKWEDEKAYSVRVSWNYANEVNAVWDDRAQMKMCIISRNRDGAIVDSMVYVLDQNDRGQRYKIVNLTRSCVTYDINMYVERNESPFNDIDQTKAFFYPIRNANDWKEFKNRVQVAGGRYDVNARLYADISTGESISWESSYAYRGVFDGNGHTITFNLADNGQQVNGPFRYVGNATIKNLRTAGTINTSQRYVSGLIGWTMEGATVNIENCRSSMTLNSTVNGEGLLAGFIGRLSASNVNIRNCKFDGSFIGGNTYCNRGYVAWVARGSNLVIENCLFAPTELKTQSADCHTWVKLDTENVSYSNINSYATREYNTYIIIRNSDDWNTFCTMVKNAKNAYWVDARLDADISVSGKDIAGYTASYPYRGTFDGNGHTINMKIEDTAQNTALFSHVANATFRNLKLTGSVTSTINRVGSLIGCVDENYTVTIENCQSSVTLKTTVTGDGCMGGFIGFINLNDNVTFTNCKFDGKFEGANCNDNGGFVGYNRSNLTIANCLFAPTALNTDFNDCHTWNRGEEAKITNSHATQYYGTETVTIDGKPFMVLRSTADWGKFLDALSKNPATNAIMDADFGIVTSAEQFNGIFDGNGHTLNINIDGGTNQCIAIFKNATDYTIKNLHVTGKIWAGMHSATFVGISSRSGATACKILNCRASNEVNVRDGYMLGGFIGRGNGADIVNCLFDGELYCTAGDPWAGAFYGFLDGDLNGAVQSCLDKAYFHNIGQRYFNINGPHQAWGNGANQWSYNNWSYNNGNGAEYVGSKSVDELVNTLGSGNWENVGGAAVPKMFKTEIPANPWATMSANDMVAALGGDWEVVDGKAVPVMATTAVETSEESFASKLGTGWVKEGETINPVTTMFDEPNYAPTPKPTLPDFYHKNTGTIDKELLTTTRQSSVLLAWNTDNNPIDYFKVLRRVQGEGDDTWKEVATNLDQMSYEDKSVSPLATYEYKVVAVNQCEGRDSTETEVKQGECKHTGRVDGYVRFNDGTGVPNVQVDANYDGKKVKSTKTDESGYFVIDELSYYEKTSAEYEVKAVGETGITFEGGVDSYTITFNATSNDETLHEFIITSGKRFSGYVMYDGTSIPVKGVNFMVNGQKIHNAKGDLVETDYDGAFSFRVMQGDNKIQAVMDNHVFVGDGYYKNAEAQNITDDVAGIYFYDATKVKLTGRIVGGNDQGLLPLGNNLSKNNLGDSLQVVLTLEGDNKSWLVYDNLNPNRTERDTVYRHPRNGQKHYTTVKTLRKRMEVTPDLKTGEYELLLPPVRWKVQQVYCKGYPTLFQEGQVNEVVDLTKCLVEKDTTYVGSYKDIDTITVSDPKLSYHAIYNRIYRAPVEVTYKQLGYDDFDYFGDKNYIASELTGKQTQVPLAYKNPADTTQALYTFTYPVFSLERKYSIRLQVGESYRYNNDPANKPDLVRVGGGIATIHNGMKDGAPKDTLHIDALGQATYYLTADQTPVLLSDFSALKTVTFSVAQDGNNYEAAPLMGYVLNMFPIGAGKDILTEGTPILYDYLRDPPGAFSSNTLAKGATLNHTYMMNLSLTAGVYIGLKQGENLQTVSATVAAPSGMGTAVGPISLSDNYDTNIDFLMYNANGSKAFSHSMVVGNNISTSGDPSMVGADADLYIGTVQNVVVTPMSSIRAVTKKMYNDMIARTGAGAQMVSLAGKYDEYGTVMKIAEGLDAKGDTLYLIRDVALGYGPKIQSQFAYSQKQLLTQIIPAKAKEIVDLMYFGTKENAQTIANNTQQPVYLSLRERTDSLFAVVNKKIKDHAYNTTIDKAEPGINYLVVLPKDKKESDFNDEVAAKYGVIKAWVDMIAQNEAEKLTVRDLMVNYDVAGAQGVNYSETFDASFSNSFTHHFPVATEVDYFGLGKGVSNVFSAVGIGSTIITGIALSLKEMKTWSVPDAKLALLDTENGMKSEVKFAGSLLQWTVFPVLSYTTIGTNSETTSYNRTESFTIATDANSHLNVDVFRAWYSTAQKDQLTAYNIFSNDNFNRMYDEVAGQVDKSLKSEKISGPRGFIFRTRGGATQNPWEDRRVTKVFEPGAELDARTLKICNPKIRLDKQSISGVAIDDAAKFTVFVSNESEKPEATDGLTVLQLFAADQANPLGAKITVNGQPLTTGGMTVSVVPGMETALTMEVRAGQGFDFEDLTIGVMSPSDAENAVATISFDVHFLREAGGVNIQTPGDKWVLNTMAQKDSERGWYIPVTINGFDRHQHNFDHIEFQYKESQRGDDSWTNLCSFYADSTLMANANGVRKMIPVNGNIVTEFFGEGWVTERTYDLRAVLFCRNGNDFLTTPSKIISGIKDTRRPQLFGTPEPKSGLLTQGDDIVFNFSEDIEYNYLSAITNFEVKGEVNNDNLSEMVSVQFAGQASVETEAKRNFSGKDLTIDMMVKPAETGREMPLFSHGTNGDKLQLWLTPDFKLKAVVNDQTFESSEAIGKNAFRQVALTINQQDSTLTFFKGGIEMGRHKLNALYNGTGPLIFGRTNELNRNESQYYEGRMMEARLWYSAMDGGLIGSTFGSRRLTGYEKDLVDYYPMNEGSGDYVNDHTQGANAKLIGASWAVPRGLSLHLEKADKGVLLNKNAMNRTNEHDYTLMFWFNTDADGRGTLLSNGRGLKEDNGAVNQFNIGFEGDKLMYRSNGIATEIPGDWSDGSWHHFALTVNRGRNVANIYMDKELRTTFETDSLGGISGGYPLIGGTRYDVVKENGDADVKDGDTPLKGYVDELLFFAQALPQQLIKTYATKSPNGDEAGLLTYLSFDRQERQKDNSIELVPYAYSKKLYLDDKGNPRYQLDPLTKEPTDTLVRDYLFADSIDAVMKHFDAGAAAPVVPYEEVKNLKFSFIGRGNQLLVELDEPATRLNHRNIYVTVRDIEDKNGNTMASPQTACYYVTKSSLSWLINKVDLTIKFGTGEDPDQELIMPFFNNSATHHTYNIENCPKWLTLDKYTDVVAPQFLESVTGKVSKDLNIGTYNEIIYLTDEEGITEPFYLNLTVEGEQPDWANSVNSDLLKNSMNINGMVYLYNELDNDSRDIVGVFDSENVCHGFANISHDVQTGETGLYLTVYDKLDSGRKLNFRLWQYSTGHEIVLTPESPIVFKKSAVLGDKTPVRFDGGEDFVQNLDLKKGWNWISFNVNSSLLNNVDSMLNSGPLKEVKIITDLGSDMTLSHKNNKWLVESGTGTITFSPLRSYAIKVDDDCSFYITGTVIKKKEDRTITLSQGWNSIGYTPMTNLTLETALSDYYDQAQQGDVIKSHTEFAIFSKSGNTGRWRGSLKYMKPGEGYMMKTMATTGSSFSYPYYETGGTSSSSQTRMRSRSRASEYEGRSSVQGLGMSTMCLCAIVEGFELEEGDKLLAYADGECCGEVAYTLPVDEEQADETLYMSISGDQQAALRFAIERGGKLVAATAAVMDFRPNAVVGSPDEPIAINFSGSDITDIRALEELDSEAGDWYSTQGWQLGDKPKRKGVYILNGKKIVVK